jgi:hypothetical protein
MSPNEVNKPNQTNSKAAKVLKYLMMGMTVEMGDYKIMMAETNTGGYKPVMIAERSSGGVVLDEVVLGMDITLESFISLAEKMTDDELIMLAANKVLSEGF